MGMDKKKTTDAEASPTASELAAQADALTHSQIEQVCARTAQRAPTRAHATRARRSPSAHGRRAQIEHAVESETEQASIPASAHGGAANQAWPPTTSRAQLAGAQRARHPRKRAAA